MLHTVILRDVHALTSSPLYNSSYTHCTTFPIKRNWDLLCLIAKNMLTTSHCIPLEFDRILFWKRLVLLTRDHTLLVFGTIWLWQKCLSHPFTCTFGSSLLPLSWKMQGPLWEAVKTCVLFSCGSILYMIYICIYTNKLYIMSRIFVNPGL